MFRTTNQKYPLNQRLLCHNIPLFLVMSRNNGSTESCEDSHSSVPGSENPRTGDDHSVMSTFTWSQYTSVDSPRAPGSPVISAPSYGWSDSHGDSTRAQGHGEPPEEIPSEPQSDTIRSDYISDSVQSAYNGEINGRSDASQWGSGGPVEGESSNQEGFAPSTQEHQDPGGSPSGLLSIPPMSSFYDTDDDRESEEQRLTPDRPLGVIEGNGPVPRERGNIGESLGAERNQPNGV